MPDEFMDEDAFFADAENTLGVEKVEEIVAETLRLRKEFGGEIKEIQQVANEMLRQGWRTVDGVVAFSFIYGVMQGRQSLHGTEDLDLEIDLDFGDEDDDDPPNEDAALDGDGAPNDDVPNSPNF
jgi:hypothetical protein